MVIGLATTPTGAGTEKGSSFSAMEKVQQFITSFTERHGSIQCGTLLGREIRTPEQFKSAAQDGAFAACGGYVQSAVEILDAMFRMEPVQ